MRLNVGGSPASLEQQFDAAAAEKPWALNDVYPVALAIAFDAPAAEGEWSFMPGLAHMPASGAGAHQLEPAGFADADEFSTHALNATLAADGLANAAAFSSHALNATLGADGFANAAAFSSHALNATLGPDGAANASAFDGVSLNATLAPAGLENFSGFARPFPPIPPMHLHATLAAGGFENESALGQATLELQPAVDGPWTLLTGEYPKPRRRRELEPMAEAARVVHLRQVYPDLRHSDAALRQSDAGAPAIEELEIREGLAGELGRPIVPRGTRRAPADDELAIALLLAA